MSELVVTGTAQIRASLAVVIGVTGDPNVVLDGSVVLGQHVGILGPFGTHIQNPLN